MSDAESYPEHRKVIQYVEFADGKDADGHGTHVAGIAAGKVNHGTICTIKPGISLLLLPVAVFFYAMMICQGTYRVRRGEGKCR